MYVYVVVVCSRLIFLGQIDEVAFGIVKYIYCLFQADLSGADWRGSIRHCEAGNSLWHWQSAQSKHCGREDAQR